MNIYGGTGGTGGAGGNGHGPNIVMNILGPGPAPAPIPRVILNELEHETFDRFIRSGRGQGLAFAERNVKLGDCGNVYRGNFHLYQNLFDEHPSIRRPPVVHKIEDGGVYVTSEEVITRVHDHGLQFVINAEHGAFAAYPLGVHKWTIDDEGPIIRYLLKHGVQLAETVEQDEYMIVTHIENAFAGMNAIWTNELRFKTDPPTCGFERNNAAEEFCATPGITSTPVGKTAFVAGITVAIALDALREQCIVTAVGSDGHVQSAQVHLPAPAVCFWCKFLSWNRAQDAQEVPKSPSETYQAKRIISDFLLYHSAHVLKMRQLCAALEYLGRQPVSTSELPPAQQNVSAFASSIDSDIKVHYNVQASSQTKLSKLYA
ncbi:hypothetical protein HMN09_01168200 [Mycena chlorophos]|uniref:Uncharacterized protein n=1 Tax=Mycena chlorophos TaxID=658473 RepID=A0A8H6S7Q8_MYCCL|nr:hypothetical protein HMN09_01168200 [Mycena chlorophos]